ncbi:hypothetical protein Tco_1310899 [Tanacetum coccineum]
MLYVALRIRFWGCYRCGDPNLLIEKCPKPLRNYNQRAFARGTWSDSDEDEEEKTKDENCLMAQASNESSKIVSTYKGYNGGNVILVSNSSGNILGKAVFTNEWDLSSLAFFQEIEGPYHTDLPTPDEIRQFLQLERIESNCTIKSRNVILSPNQILTKELRQYMKRWEELIHENVFGLGGHQDHLPACLAHMLYCIAAEEQYNLAYFFAKRIESARATLTANLPYGMFLTRLF